MLNTVNITSLASSKMSPWLAKIPEEPNALGASGTHIVERHLDIGEHLYFEGDKASHVYFVLSGVIGLYKLLGDGRRQISTFAYPGDVIGLDTINTYVNNGEALNSAVVRSIPVNDIEKLIRTEPGFGKALLLLTATELADTREQLLSLGRKSAAEKLATFLVRIARRSSHLEDVQSQIPIPMKRSDIADFLGLTIETVSRCFTKLKVARIIQLKRSSQLEILDMEKLESIASGNGLTAIH